MGSIIQYALRAELVEYLCQVNRYDVHSIALRCLADRGSNQEPALTVSGSVRFGSIAVIRERLVSAKSGNWIESE